MKSILAAVDLAESGARALRRAATIARGSGTGLVVFHAVDDDLPDAIRSSHLAEAEASSGIRSPPLMACTRGWRCRQGMRARPRTARLFAQRQG